MITLVSMCILPPTASEAMAASKRPQRFTSDLKVQLSDLDYLCSRVSLASKCLYELNDTQEEEEVYDPLTCVASPQVKKTTKDNVTTT